MEIKKIMVSLALVLVTLFASASDYARNNRFFGDSQKNADLLESMDDPYIGWILMEWGWMQNGQFAEGHDMSASHQMWMLCGGAMLHVGTDDGDCAYDATRSGDTVYIRNQSKRTSDGQWVTTNAGYDGWIKVKGISSDNLVLTLDNLGVYRVFMLKPLK